MTGCVALLPELGMGCSDVVYYEKYSYSIYIGAIV
jgi:hypothetical protein